MPLVIPSVPGALFGDDLRTAFSISGIVISGHSIDGGYVYPSTSERSACRGGGKKVWRSVSAFSPGSWARPPSCFTSAGVQPADMLCLFLAHLTRFQRPDGDADASSTLWR